MKLGDVVRFTSDQAIGHELREKIHVFVGKTEHHRAPDEYAFLFISSADHSGCYPIACAAYPQFLMHDSFISCGNLVFYSFTYLSAAKLKKVGEVEKADLLALRNHLANHDVMETWQINVVCNALAVLV